MRSFVADTFAMIAFSTVVGMAIEILVSGMTLGQSGQARLTAVPLNLLTARLYGVFRDWIFKITKANNGGQVRQGLADILAFVVFQVPLYALILALSGATWVQIIAACGTIALFSGFMGRPYGIFLEFSRWLFRVKGKAV